MKRIITYSIIALLQASVALAQPPVAPAKTSSKPKLQKREKYEWQGEIPTYVETLKKELAYPMAWGNSPIKNFKKWKKTARAKVFECMMTPPKAAAAWDMEVLGEEQRDGYKAQKIAFNINAYSRITAYLLIPDGGAGRFPAVVALHDHGAHLFIGKEKMIRPFFIASEEQDADGKISEKKKAANQEVLDDADAWVNQLYEGQYVGDYLAKHGYVVLSIDAPMWGERGRKEGVDRNKYDLIAGNMMMLGRDLSAFMTYDDIASTDFLASLPMVDANRIGCAGCSMGAYRSWMLSALSDRIKVGASVCWMITTDAQLTRRYGRKENGGFANCIPGLRQYLDYPHIASLACPKPMLFINGTKDKLFPVPGVKDAFRQMHEVWRSQKADERLDTEIWDIPHSCGIKAQAKILEFLDQYLKK
jgi:dienelactone hydrolase